MEMETMDSEICYDIDVWQDRYPFAIV